MPIWSSEIKELEKLYESLKGQFPDLERELERLIKADDENMILLYSRRCLEVIITDLCECELKRPRKTEPLQGIIDKLHKEEKVPAHIIASMQSLNSLSTFGAHPKDFDPEQIKPVLVNLDIIIKWYLKHKQVRTEVAESPINEIGQEIKRAEVLKKSIKIPKKWLPVIISGFIIIIVIVIAVLFLTGTFGSNIQTKELEKSIAVLPFKSLSTDPEKQYLADGIMDAITLHLSKIKDLRVLGRTSTEQYRNPTKTLTEIGKELDVSYLLEGSFQKFDDSVRLIVQLIMTGKEGHVWAKDYYRLWNNIFSVQSEVAESIARELNAAITPEEEQLIEKIPTTNLTAYDFYQMGKSEERFPYDLVFSSSIAAGIESPSEESVERSEKMYKTALKYDPTFAPAYIGLASIYWYKNYFKEYFSENFLDSVYNLAQKALSFDDQLADGYFIRGMYFSEHSKYQRQAYEDFDKTLKLNPNYWQAYFAKGEIEEDPVMSIKNYQEAASRHHGPGLSEIYEKISFKLSYTGFSESAKNFSLEAVKLESDSAKYYFWLYMYEFEYKKCYPFYKRKYSTDSTDLSSIEFLGEYYSNTGQFKEALLFHKKWLKQLKADGKTTINGLQRVGYSYWKNGFRDSADYYFNRQIEYCNNAITVDRSSYSTTYYDLAGVYAFMGDNIKAYENLKIHNTRPGKWYLWTVRYIKYDPLFDSIRNEPEFQQIVREMEAKYQAEHERMKRWLEEQGML